MSRSEPKTDELCAGDVMTRKFLTVAPEDTLGETVEQMVETAAGSALVVDFGRLIGVLTSRDVLRAIADRVHPSEARVREWMTPDPVTAARETPVEDAARLMLAGGFHHLPVVADESPIGVVGLRTVAGAVGGRFPGW